MAKASKVLSAREVFARNLRRARQLRGLSQEELGFAAGVSRNYVSVAERSGYNLSIDNMEALATALNVPLAHLIDAEKFNGLPSATHLGLHVVP